MEEREAKRRRIGALAIQEQAAPVQQATTVVSPQASVMVQQDDNLCSLSDYLKSALLRAKVKLAEDEIATLMETSGATEIEDFHDFSESDWMSVGLKLAPSKKLVRALKAMKESE